jgi:hypothetical protein
LVKQVPFFGLMARLGAEIEAVVGGTVR